MSQKSLSSLLKTGAVVSSSIVQNAKKIKQLDEWLQTVLPTPLTHQVHLANIQADRLVVITHSAAWATRLRFHQNEILLALKNEHGLSCSRLEVKVQPSYRPATPSLVDRSISDSNSLLLQQTAEHIADKPLADVLKRLARRGS